MNSNRELGNRDNFIVVLLGVVLAYIVYASVIEQLPEYMSDYNGHLNVYYQLFKKETILAEWQNVPYFMWHLLVLVLNRALHIPLEASAAFSSCIFSLFSYFVMSWMLRRVFRRVTGEDCAAKAGLLAFGFSIVQGIYCYWLDVSEGRYLGIFSINPLHNPTQMCVQGFSLLCLCLVYDIWGRQKSDAYPGVFFRVEQGLKKYYIMLSVLLFCSVMAKPAFAEIFIPSVALLMLWDWLGKLRRKDGSASAYFKNCLSMMYCAIPSLAYLLLQFVFHFAVSDSAESEEAAVVFTGCMEVWRIFSENIALSILLGMAFPFFVILLNPSYFFKKDMGRLALTTYMIGLAEAAFLGEGGEKFKHANFLWPMISGMLLMWAVSLMRLIALEATQADNRQKRVLIDIGWFLFFIHVLGGCLYLM